ncbi:hypothetical protein [Aerosakkonema funiforme]|uniref:hypothetical protein n=1 Tax=Aerosakkonema funiforme TaxID=1246630 RepID=UPI0035B9B916
MELSSEWNNEAYVSLHLVQTMLEKAGLPRKSGYSHWIPEFKVKVPKLALTGHIECTQKEVDFLIEDLSRYINFLIEIKTAETRIDDDARLQLQTYLKYSHRRFGVLVDPFLVEIYEYTEWQPNLRCKYEIENPNKVQPIANFLINFLDKVKMLTM